MKKFLSLLLAFSACFALVACEDEDVSNPPANPPAHTHEYASEWSKDDTHHWYACTGEDCTETKDKAEHNWNAGVVDGDTKTFICTDCGKTKTEAVQTDYEVTADEWETALKLQTPITRAAQYVCRPEFINDPFVYYDVIEYGDDIIHCYETDETKENVIYEYYYVKNGDACVCYKKMGAGDWIIEDSSLSTYMYKFDRVSGWDNEYGMQECFSYEDFTYNPEKQAYTCETIVVDWEGEAQVLYNVELKFIDGKLKTFYLESVTDGYCGVETIFDYEKIEIILPDVQR